LGGVVLPYFSKWLQLHQRSCSTGEPEPKPYQIDPKLVRAGLKWSIFIEKTK